MAPQALALAQEIRHPDHHATVKHHRQFGPAGAAQALLRIGEPRDPQGRHRLPSG